MGSVFQNKCSCVGEGFHLGQLCATICCVLFCQKDTSTRPWFPSPISGAPWCPDGSSSAKAALCFLRMFCALVCSVPLLFPRLSENTVVSTQHYTLGSLVATCELSVLVTSERSLPPCRRCRGRWRLLRYNFPRGKSTPPEQIRL